MAVHLPLLNPKEVYLALTDPNTLATTLQIILLSQYGSDIYEVDPVELFLRLEDDFGSKPCEEAENRINAIILATSTDIFYQDPDAFTAICEALASGDPGLDFVDPLTAAEVLWGVYETELNHGPGDFNKQVESLIDSIVREDAGEMNEENGASHEDGVVNFLDAMRSQLHTQLEAIGIKGFHLPPVKPQ